MGEALWASAIWDGVAFGEPEDSLAAYEILDVAEDVVGQFAAHDCVTVFDADAECRICCYFEIGTFESGVVEEGFEAMHIEIVLEHGKVAHLFLRFGTGGVVSEGFAEGDDAAVFHDAEELFDCLFLVGDVVKYVIAYDAIEGVVFGIDTVAIKEACFPVAFCIFRYWVFGEELFSESECFGRNVCGYYRASHLPDHLRNPAGSCTEIEDFQGWPELEGFENETEVDEVLSGFSGGRKWLRLLKSG